MKRYIKSSAETERPIYPSTLREAIKFGFIDKLDLDLYKAEDGRYILYDRYRPGNSAWVSSDGYAYRNFFECWRQDTGWAKKLNPVEMQKYSDEYGIKFQSNSITAATSTEDKVIYRFKVGQQLSAPMLYGGTVFYEVVSRTANTVTVRESHVSEDTGDEVNDGTSTHDIEYQDVYDYSQRVDGEFKFLGLAEVFEIWEYHGHKGYCSSDPNT